MGKNYCDPSLLATSSPSLCCTASISFCHCGTSFSDISLSSSSSLPSLLLSSVPIDGILRFFFFLSFSSTYVSSLSPLSSSLSLMCMHVREFPQFFFHYDSFLTHKWIDAGPGEKTDRAQSDKVNLGNGYPMANYEDEKFFQCRQTTTVPHVVSEAPRVRRVELVWETSKSTPSQALGLGSSRGARRSTQWIGPRYQSTRVVLSTDLN